VVTLLCEATQLPEVVEPILATCWVLHVPFVVSASAVTTSVVPASRASIAMTMSPEVIEPVVIVGLVEPVPVVPMPPVR